MIEKLKEELIFTAKVIEMMRVIVMDISIMMMIINT